MDPRDSRSSASRTALCAGAQSVAQLADGNAFTGSTDTRGQCWIETLCQSSTFRKLVERAPASSLKPKALARLVPGSGLCILRTRRVAEDLYRGVRTRHDFLGSCAAVSIKQDCVWASSKVPSMHLQTRLTVKLSLNQSLWSRMYGALTAVVAIALLHVALSLPLEKPRGV